MIKTNVYEHNFGIIIPCKSGVIWEQQTAGVMCRHIEIEGVYLMLAYPIFYDKKNNRHIGLLHQLTQANYKHKDTTDIWKKIDNELVFQYKRIEAPKGQPPNQEGLQWIVITKIKKRLKDYVFEDWRNKHNEKEFKGLIDKKVALIYPNCD